MQDWNEEKGRGKTCHFFFFFENIQNIFLRSLLPQQWRLAALVLKKKIRFETSIGIFFAWLKVKQGSKGIFLYQDIMSQRDTKQE